MQRQRQRILRNLRRTTRTVIPRKIERSLTTVGVVVGNKANEYAPLDTSALINSQDRELQRRQFGYTVTVKYTQGYAAALHNRTDWSPKPPGSPGKPDGGWNPNARPGWLTYAAEQVRPTVIRIVTGDLRL